MVTRGEAPGLRSFCAHLGVEANGGRVVFLRKSRIAFRLFRLGLFGRVVSVAASEQAKRVLSLIENVLTCASLSDIS